MRNEKYLVLFLVILMLNMKQVDAQDLQGLSWGLEVGDQFEYTWTVTIQESPSSNIITSVENITLEITDLGPISTSHFSWMGDLNYAVKYFSNGSVLTRSIDWSAVPIGNWTLMEELLTEYTQDPGLEGLDITLSSSTWRVESDHNHTVTGQITNTTYEYSILDGAISYLYIQIWNHPTEDYHEIRELVRISPLPSSPPPFPAFDPIVLIVLGGGFGVVAIAIIIIKLRNQ
jgi:hypothetical protein